MISCGQQGELRIRPFISEVARVFICISNSASRKVWKIIAEAFIQEGTAVAKSGQVSSNISEYITNNDFSCTSPNSSRWRMWKSDPYQLHADDQRPKIWFSHLAPMVVNE